MDKKELWHEMLTTYCSRMHYTGLTLPNMIGAYYYYCKFNYEDYDLSSSNCVFRVLDDISNSLKDMGVLIRYCGHIRKYVLSPLEDKNMQHPKLNDRIFLQMYDLHLQTNSSSMEDLAEYLYSLHQKEIMEKNFSLKNGIWQPLSNIEREYIDNIIHSL